MRKHTGEPLERVHLWLYKADADYIREKYGDVGGIGFSTAARTMLRKYIRALKEKENKTAKPLVPAPQELPQNTDLELLDD